MTTRTMWGRVAVVALICACSSAPKEPDPPPADTENGQHGVIDDTRMLRHWIVATDLRDAVVRGNLSEAVNAARRLETHGPVQPETVWLPHVAAVGEQIANAKGAESLVEAARATAGLGAACGDCHISLGAKVEMPSGGVPPEGTSPREHMQRHAWGVDAMWAGLVTPSNGRWSDGVGVFAEQALHETDSNSELITTEVVKEIGTKIHDLAIRGAAEDDPAQRAAIFADLIAACGDCHGQTHGGPAHAPDTADPRVDTLGDAPK